MGICGSTADGPAKSKLSGKDRYKILDELGKGHFAEVRSCVDVETGVKYAIKIIDKKDLVKSEAVVKEEIAILRQVGHHKHVVALEDTFEDEKQFYLVMELCVGGDLFSKIVSEGKYSEKRAIRCCKQLAEALQWIHRRGVTHRDLKPENILLMSDDIDADIKVADFGLSKLMKNQADVMRTVCGTWAYCAPEVIARKPYTQAVDNWTLGVLMFILLSGYHPFDVYGELPEPQLLRKIMDCSYDFDDDVWLHVSEEAKNLIRGLLKLEPRDRISLDTFLSSNWIKGEHANDRELPLVVTRLGKLNKGRRAFRALVLAKLASKKFKRNLDRSRSKNPSSQSISLGSYPHGGFLGDAESARSDRSDVASHRTYEVKYSGATVVATPVHGAAPAQAAAAAGKSYSPNGPNGHNAGGTTTSTSTFILTAPPVQLMPPSASQPLAGAPMSGSGPSSPVLSQSALQHQHQYQHQHQHQQHQYAQQYGGNGVNPLQTPMQMPTHSGAHAGPQQAVGVHNGSAQPLQSNGFMISSPTYPSSSGGGVDGSGTGGGGSGMSGQLSPPQGGGLLRPHGSGAKEAAPLGQRQSNGKGSALPQTQPQPIEPHNPALLIAPPQHAIAGAGGVGVGGGLLAPPAALLPGAATNTPPGPPSALSAPAGVMLTAPAALLVPPAGLVPPSPDGSVGGGSGSGTPNHAHTIGANGLVPMPVGTPAPADGSVPAGLQPPAAAASITLGSQPNANA